FQIFCHGTAPFCLHRRSYLQQGVCRPHRSAVSGVTTGAAGTGYNDEGDRRSETMAMVRSITITPTIAEQGKEAGAVTGHAVEARVEVGGEERVYDLSGVSPTLTTLVEQLVRAVHQETLQESRPDLQSVVDAEKAFDR